MQGAGLGRVRWAAEDAGVRGLDASRALRQPWPQPSYEPWGSSHLPQPLQHPYLPQGAALSRDWTAFFGDDWAGEDETQAKGSGAARRKRAPELKKSGGSEAQGVSPRVVVTRVGTPAAAQEQAPV